MRKMLKKIIAAVMAVVAVLPAIAGGVICFLFACFLDGRGWAESIVFGIVCGVVIWAFLTGINID